jgi:hypothetical protein
MLDDRHLDVPPHHLQRLPQTLPRDAGAVDVVPVDDLLQSARELIQPGA